MKRYSVYYTLTINYDLCAGLKMISLSEGLPSLIAFIDVEKISLNELGGFLHFSFCYDLKPPRSTRNAPRFSREEKAI